MELEEIVRRYLAAAGAFGKQFPLDSLGLSKETIEDVFSGFDEDYHISRFFHLTCEGGATLQTIYRINGFPQTHVSIDAEIQSIL
ncbi:MAG: hypothetical protein ABSA57_11390 [Candidatus Acidiferrales bacterium]|jgi:hypothetical protein